MQTVHFVYKMSDIQNSPISGLSFCTKGGRLLAQERSNITSSKASQPQTPHTNKNKKQTEGGKKHILVKLLKCLHSSTRSVKR